MDNIYPQVSDKWGDNVRGPLLYRRRNNEDDKTKAYLEDLEPLYEALSKLQSTVNGDSSFVGLNEQVRVLNRTLDSLRGSIKGAKDSSAQNRRWLLMLGLAIATASNLSEIATLIKALI